MKNVLPRRKATRLPAFDYRSAGPYFVTICTQYWEHRFGTIVADDMHSNSAGKMAENIWAAIPDQFPVVILDLFVIMPNHVHGLLWFDPDGV